MSQNASHQRKYIPNELLQRKTDEVHRSLNRLWQLLLSQMLRLFLHYHLRIAWVILLITQLCYSSTADTFYWRETKGINITIDLYGDTSWNNIECVVNWRLVNCDDFGWWFWNFACLFLREYWLVVVHEHNKMVFALLEG